MAITYTDKVQNAVNPLPVTEQWRAVDANEVKTVVNANETTLTGKLDKANSAVALVDGATMDLSGPVHTLATSAATRTFTISYTGDDIVLEVTLSATSSTFTFPATSKCVSEGEKSGNNILSVAGTSGDVYIIAIKKVGSNYRIACKNFG